MASQVVGESLCKEYELLVRPHVSSFDYFLGDGMQQMVDDLEPLEVSVRAVGGCLFLTYNCVNIILLPT